MTQDKFDITIAVGTHPTVRIFRIDTKTVPMFKNTLQSADDLPFTSPMQALEDALVRMKG